jgi:tRNA(Arg) A34 adenosine deaminase TadA
VGVTVEDDAFYMNVALEAARRAACEDEIPIGAVVVSPEGEILSVAVNASEHGKTALEHAEIRALNEAAAQLGQIRLWGCALYVTIEPCPMCAAAISFMRIKRLVFGAPNPKGGAVVNGVRFYADPTCNHRPEVVGGVLADPCGEEVAQFFRKKRV